MTGRRDHPLGSLVFTVAFLEELSGSSFNKAERKKFWKALDLLDENERHPSLEVHQLAGNRSGEWAAKADQALRLTFERLPGGRKLLVGCTHHYRD
jgi:hypothetical protein